MIFFSSRQEKEVYFELIKDVTHGYLGFNRVDPDCTKGTQVTQFFIFSFFSWLNSKQKTGSYQSFEIWLWPDRCPPCPGPPWWQRYNCCHNIIIIHLLFLTPFSFSFFLNSNKSSFFFFFLFLPFSFPPETIQPTGLRDSLDLGKRVIESKFFSLFFFFFGFFLTFREQ